MHAKPVATGFPAAFSFIFLVFFLQGCISVKPAPTDEYYAVWAKKHDAEVSAYQAFLDEQAVGDIVPLSQLLKSIFP